MNKIEYHVNHVKVVASISEILQHRPKPLLQRQTPGGVHGILGAFIVTQSFTSALNDSNPWSAAMFITCFHELYDLGLGCFLLKHTHNIPSRGYSTDRYNFSPQLKRLAIRCNHSLPFRIPNNSVAHNKPPGHQRNRPRHGRPPQRRRHRRPRGFPQHPRWGVRG